MGPEQTSTLKNDPSKNSAQCSVYYNLSPFWLMEWELSPALYELWELLSLFFLVIISLASWSFAPHKCRPLAEDLRGPFWSSLELLCITNSSLLGLPKLWALINLMRTQDFLWIPLTCIAAYKQPPVNKLGNHWTHLVCFSSFRDHSPIFLVAQCLLNF